MNKFGERNRFYIIDREGKILERYRLKLTAMTDLRRQMREHFLGQSYQRHEIKPLLVVTKEKYEDLKKNNFKELKSQPI